MAMNEMGNKKGQKSESRRLMSMEKPINPSKDGFISTKGPGCTLDKQTRPIRPNKILF
jgi:hypothetical protein